MQCTRCDNQAERSLGTEWLCADCHEAILAPIRARVLERDMLQETTHGKGVQCGPLEPDYGAGWAHLACDQCGATWVGKIGAACSWCQDRYQRLLDEQAQTVLTPPDVDHDDINYPAAIVAWAERLNRAVIAEIVSVEEASRAYRKAVRDERAA